MSPRRPGASAHCQSSPKADFWQFAHFFSRPHSKITGPGTEPAIAREEACSRVNFRRILPSLLTLAGESIYVERGGKVYEYQVTDTKVVEPREISVLKPFAGNQLTLITCYPIHYIGPAPKRLIVFAQSSNSAGQGENRPFAGDESR